MTQTTLSPYLIGGTWVDDHPAAADFAEAIAHAANAAGRDCSFRDEVLPGLRANAHRYGLTADPTRQYAITHNIISEIERHLEWTRGVRFTKRRAACDLSATAATPDSTRDREMSARCNPGGVEGPRRDTDLRRTA